ncbi:MAG: SPASM domain-containing protein [Bacteroidetes bacterium]|nr:SPASM domain-containing protein [Bacteroidota bacterium]
MWQAKLRDGFNFFLRLSPRRTLNGAKIFSSYFISRITKNPKLWGMPIAISIEPTTSCNLRCPECPSGLRSFTRATGMLQLPLFKKVIDEIAPTSPYLILYFQGEPYLNKNFFDFVSYAEGKKMYVATSTNAHYMNDENARKTVESGLSRLIISIDGTTQDTYESYRVGGNLDKVIEGTKNIIKWRKKLKSSTPHIIFQYLVVKPNEHQIDDVVRIGKELGVDEVRFKTAQIYDFENGSDLMPTIDKYSRYKKNADGKFSLKNNLFNHCWKMWHSCVFTWDGKVVPCCFDKDASHPMGSIEEVGFKTIWQGDKYKNFRRALLTSRTEIDICQNCTEGTKIWA